jgi:AraC family transcriptional regulator
MVSADERHPEVTLSRFSDGPGTSAEVHTVPEYDARLLLHRATVTAWAVECQGLCRAKAAEEHTSGARIAFPHRGVYVHSVGRKDHVADANHMVVTNAYEPYRVSHPVAGGDATLTLAVDPQTLLEVAPREYRSARERPALNRSSLRIDARTQVLAAQLRQRLLRRSIDRLEAETLALQLVRNALGHNADHAHRHNNRRPEKIADQVKMLLAADPRRRWTLATIAKEVSVTPVYLTDAFRRVEGIPLYRYHLRLRLAYALTMLADCEDLMTLAVELGFHSHSHFSSAFKKTFGQTPTDFKRSVVGQSARDTKVLDS